MDYAKVSAQAPSPTRLYTNEPAKSESVLVRAEVLRVARPERELRAETEAAEHVGLGDDAAERGEVRHVVGEADAGVGDEAVEEAGERAGERAGAAEDLEAERVERGLAPEAGYVERPEREREAAGEHLRTGERVRPPGGVGETVWIGLVRLVEEVGHGPDAGEGEEVRV